jgi:hypothetical protein
LLQPLVNHATDWVYSSISSNNRIKGQPNLTIQLDSIRDKVRSILERANHPNTPQAEAETALTLAYRLMQKYNLDEYEISKSTGKHSASDEIKIKTFKITGPYRVRRGTLLYTIAKAVSCHSYRDKDVPNHQTVVMVAYGAAGDLFALETLFHAAELLALRTMPHGDRCYRTSWWLGFCSGIARKLERECRVIIKESPGVGLVLVERAERARTKMLDDIPNLRYSSYSYINDEDAYGSGRRAGSQFTTGRNSVNSQHQIGSGRHD